MSIEISALFDERLTDGDRVQLVLLDALSKAGECCVSDARLAEIRHVTRRTVCRSMHALAEHGFIEIDNSQGVRRILLRTQMSQGRTQMSQGETQMSQGETSVSTEEASVSSPPHTPPIVYRSIDLDPIDLADPSIRLEPKTFDQTSFDRVDDPPPIVPPLAEPAQAEPKAKRKRGNVSEDSPAFAAFWLAYPRHVAKTTARRAWDRLAPDEKLVTEIMAGLEASKRSWKGKDQQYIPYPTTWLNQRRWEDDEQYGRTGNDNRNFNQHSHQHLQPSDWTGGRITPDDGTQFLEYVRRAREKSGRTSGHEEYDLSLLS